MSKTSSNANDNPTFQELALEEANLNKEIKELGSNPSVVFWRLRYVAQGALWAFVLCVIWFNWPVALMFFPLVVYYGFLGNVSGSKEVAGWELALLARKELKYKLDYAAAVMFSSWLSMYSGKKNS